MRKILLSLAGVALIFNLSLTRARAAGKATHVIVIVWDGMRPDFVTEQNCPTLFKLAQQGVWFQNHHPVFMSATEVNGTAIATGDYPGHDGIIGNKEFKPKIDPLKPNHTEDFNFARRGDAVTGGHYILVPTVAEILHKKGIKTAVAGAKPIAFLHDRQERPANSPNIDLYAGATLPPEALAAITQLQGKFPGGDQPIPTRNDWTTSALIDSLWKEAVPAFSLLWMNQPDAAQHQTGPGSPQSLAAIKDADNNLARVLKALDGKGVRATTDILLVSDHGFSTILSTVDLAEVLRAAGFKAEREFKSKPAVGEIVVSGNGGSVLLYVTGHEKKTIEQLVKFLQGWNFTGVIFTKEAMPGTFTLAQARINSPDAPDVLVALRWNADRSETGTAGMLNTDLSTYGPGQGMHGSLSAYDMHNTFVAAGPDFKSGIIDHLPTGNVDVAPTALWILGIKPPKPMDGRVVLEAMTVNESKIKSYAPAHLEAARELETAVWHQYLNSVEVNGVVYFDEGNGFQKPK